MIQINVSIQSPENLRKLSLPGRAGTFEVLFAFGITLCSVRLPPAPTARPLHVRVRPPNTHKVICHDASAPIKFPFPFLIAWAPLFRRNRQENAQPPSAASVTDPRHKFKTVFSGPKPYGDSSPLKGYAFGWISV